MVELAALRRYHRWAVREGLRPDDPTAQIELRAAEPYRDLTALSADQVRSLLAAIPDSDEGARLRCLLLWYLLSGRRRVEILRLRWGDLDLEAGTYTYTRKGGQEREAVTPPRPARPDPRLRAALQGPHRAGAPRLPRTLRQRRA